MRNSPKGGYRTFPILCVPRKIFEKNLASRTNLEMAQTDLYNVRISCFLSSALLGDNNEYIYILLAGVVFGSVSVKMSRFIPTAWW